MRVSAPKSIASSVVRRFTTQFKPNSSRYCDRGCSWTRSPRGSSAKNHCSLSGSAARSPITASSNPKRRCPEGSRRSTRRRLRPISTTPQPPTSFDHPRSSSATLNARKSTVSDQGEGEGVGAIKKTSRELGKMAIKFEDYANKYKHIKLERRNGILQLTRHTNGKDLIWGAEPHDELSFLFGEIARDP